MNDLTIITLNLQGTIFKTHLKTIRLIPWFANYLEDWGCPKEEIFIDRPAHIFKHVLALGTDPKYNYLIKYLTELDFYLINKSEVVVYDPASSIVFDITKDVDNSLKTLQTSICHEIRCRTDSILIDLMKRNMPSTQCKVARTQQGGGYGPKTVVHPQELVWDSHEEEYVPKYQTPRFTLSPNVKPW